MADKFKVGQLVVMRLPAVETGFGWEILNGEIGQVIAPKRVRLTQVGPRNGPKELERCVVYGVQWRGQILALRERYLKPLYDGNQPVSWSECAWQPREVAQHG